jgi:hypothetical protein
MSATLSEPKTAEQLARELAMELDQWIQRTLGGIPSPTPDEQTIRKVEEAILRATEPLEKRVKELEAERDDYKKAYEVTERNRTAGFSASSIVQAGYAQENARLKAELAEAKQYGAYKDETATTFMNQVKRLQSELALIKTLASQVLLTPHNSSAKLMLAEAIDSAMKKEWKEL